MSKAELFNKAPQSSDPENASQNASQNADHSEMFPAPPAIISLAESLQTAGATVEALDRQNESLQHSKELAHNEGE